MREDAISTIRQSIALARKDESLSSELHRYLESMSTQLHSSISLPSDNPAAALFDFLTCYVENVPNALEALSIHMREAGIYKDGEVFLDIASDFFISPPEMTQAHTGLLALLDEAYLAHRMFEEINDRLILLCGKPLIPVDMTSSNIIVHDILGEDFANQLDLAVHYAVEALFQTENIAANPRLNAFMDMHKSLDWQRILNEWPSLTKKSDLNLEIGGVGF